MHKSNNQGLVPAPGGCPRVGKLTVFSRPHYLDFFVTAAAAMSCDFLSSPTTILSLLFAVHGGTPWPRYS